MHVEQKTHTISLGTMLLTLLCAPLLSPVGRPYGDQVPYGWGNPNPLNTFQLSPTDAHIRESEFLQKLLCDPQMKQFIYDDADLSRLIEEGKRRGYSPEQVRRNAEKLIARSEIMNALTHRLRHSVKESKGLEVSDVIARGIAGKNWRAVADLHSDGILQAVGNVAVYKGAQVFGNHLSDSIERSVGDWLDTFFGGTLSLIADKMFSAWRTLRNKVTGLHGVPFSGRELKLWRETSSRMLSDLERLAKNASIMDARSRDKVLRMVDESDEEEPVDPSWAGQRNSFGKEFEFLCSSITKRRSYYDPQRDEAVIFYAQQIEALLHEVKDNVLSRVRSYRDLGASSVQSALCVARNTLDLYFYNLMTLVAPQVAGERESSDGNYAGMHRPEQSTYSNSFSDYGSYF